MTPFVWPLPDCRLPTQAIAEAKLAEVLSLRQVLHNDLVRVADDGDPTGAVVDEAELRSFARTYVAAGSCRLVMGDRDAGFGEYRRASELYYELAHHNIWQPGMTLELFDPSLRFIPAPSWAQGCLDWLDCFFLAAASYNVELLERLARNAQLLVTASTATAPALANHVRLLTLWAQPRWGTLSDSDYDRATDRAFDDLERAIAKPLSDSPHAARHRLHLKLLNSPSANSLANLLRVHADGCRSDSLPSDWIAVDALGLATVLRKCGGDLRIDLTPVPFLPVAVCQ